MTGIFCRHSILLLIAFVPIAVFPACSRPMNLAISPHGTNQVTVSSVPTPSSGRMSVPILSQILRIRLTQGLVPRLLMRHLVAVRQRI